MEEGSLLEVALQHGKTLCNHSACESLQKNCILLDLHALDYRSKHRTDHLLYLAELADYCNLFFQNKGHLWHYGADGPIFGVYVDQSESVPHLRAYCRYGPSVQDGWMAIHYVVELIKSVRDDEKKQNIVASAWDVQDGQIILIQLADLLPAWLDEDPADNHRHACWIDQDGNLQLLRRPHIALREALQELERRATSHTKSASHPKMQRALNYWLDLNAQAASVHQRAPMVLPRKVAGVFRDRPELLRTAIQAFCESIQQDGPIAPAPIQFDLTKYEDWVWTVQTLSRTNYAMARTVSSSSRSDWTSSPDSTPMPAGVELKRLKRQCKMESMKHLKNAVSLGVRAVAGLEKLMNASNDDGSFASSKPLSSLEERIVYWTRVQQMSCLDNGNLSETILESYHMGPNRSDLDLTNVLKCPVFPEEDHNWTSYSSPQVSLRDQIRSTMRMKQRSDTVRNDDEFWVPRPDQVDGEDWMDYKPAKSDSVDTVESEHDVDNLLSRFHSFLKQTSGVEGVSSNKVNGDETDRSIAVKIRPRVFLNILHSVLKGKELDFPRVDPFFYHEDYRLMEQDVDNDDGDDHGVLGDDAPSLAMGDLMTAMDDELEARTESRKIASDVLVDGSDADPKNDQEKALVKGLAQDAHVLSNLMQSLDASGGGSGPVGNILKEMGGTT
mmetsp:Transcript_11366/g.32732  ORF Transcript_11366/g.32732 Transcript_11366/m.32732 type:complete len:670 (+) Transcript_11366:46-2055(+)